MDPAARRRTAITFSLLSLTCPSPPFATISTNEEEEEEEEERSHHRGQRSRNVGSRHILASHHPPPKGWMESQEREMDSVCDISFNLERFLEVRGTRREPSPVEAATALALADRWKIHKLFQEKRRKSISNYSFL